MTPEESVREVMTRLRAVDWERHGHRSWSRAALLREFFRRAAQWASACDSSSYTPFFDIAECVAPGVRADKALVTAFQGELEQAGAQWDVVNVTPHILHWAALRATPEISLPHLDDPFEPLILMFERDGGFHLEQGGVNLEWKTVRTRGWRERADDPPMPSFDEQALDEIDLAGSMKQFGKPPAPL